MKAKLDRAINEQFIKKVEQLRARVDEFYDRARSGDHHPPDELLEEALEELKISVEELLVAEEEMSQQQEEIQTAHAQAEAERRRYLDLFQFAPDSYLVTDENGKILEANHSAAILLNVDQHFLAGRLLISFVDPPGRKAFRQQLLHFASLCQAKRRKLPEEHVYGIPLSGEWYIRLRRRNGVLFDATLTITILPAQEGTRLRWIIRDVTERQQAQEALRESEAKFHTLAETTSVAIAIVQDGRILYANPALSQATGYPIAELLEKEFLEIIHPSWRRLLEAQGIVSPAPSEEGLSSEPVSLHWEIQLHTHDEQERWVDLSAGRMEYRRWPAWVISAYDITGRVVAQRERTELLRRLVTVQEGERRRISRELHDQVGQGLSALILSLNSIQAGAPPLLTRKLQQLSRLASELEQETHRMARDLRPAALDDLGLQAALAHYAEEWSELSGIAVDCQMNLPPDETLPGETATAIYRIVQEALANVAKHANASKVSIILDRRKEELLAIVEDNGLGFSLTESLTSIPTGSRLGLLGMKERAELLGGTWMIESVPGKGTTVFVHIPLTQDKEAGRDE